LSATEGNPFTWNLADREGKRSSTKQEDEIYSMGRLTSPLEARILYSMGRFTSPLEARTLYLVRRAVVVVVW
jgi:hypothetical protein